MVRQAEQLFFCIVFSWVFTKGSTRANRGNDSV